uniref:Dynein heavy chain domain-containing protein 1 n=1 Tax=Knipowitschia caucasica TaxID=637954 RepID=A0AAV2LHX3_KNICA
MPPVQPKTRAHAPLPPVSQPVFSQPVFSQPVFSQPESSSVLQLPRLIAVVGPRTALLQRRWSQGPQLVTSALGTELPGTSTQNSLPEPEQTKLPQDRPSRCTQSPALQRPLKVSEVLQLLCTGGPSQVFYLKEAPGPVRRPYELQVVAPSEAGEEHYIFCRSGVIHMTLSGYGGMSSLSQWYNEAASWTILQNIPFFRLFRLRKAFCWWRARVRYCRFLQLSEHLQSLLLTDSALYRAAQAAHARTLEEVQATPWLPQSGAYNLTGLIEAQQNHREQFQRKLRDLSQSCREVLQTVQQQSMQSLQHLKHHIHLSEQARCFSGPMHLQWRHQKQLRRERARAQRDVTRLSSLARLLHYMTVETLLCVLQTHVHTFALSVVQTQSLVFHTQLSVRTHGHLRVEPELHCFSQLLRDLLSPTYFHQQVCDTCGIFDETSAQDRFSSKALDLSKLSTTFSPESMRHSVQEFCCCQLVQRQQSPDLMQQFQTTGNPGACGLPEAPGQIQSLNRELLEWTLSMCDLSKAVGAAERFMQEESDLDWLYDKYSWLLKVREFVESWGPALSVDPRGPCVGAYEEHIVKVQKWLSWLRSVPPSVSSTRQLFVICCTEVTQELEERLKVISEELLINAVEQVRVSSETLLSELERLVADLLPTPQDFTCYTVKVKQGFSLWPDLKQRLEDTRSVQNIIVIHYRDVTAEEHKLSEQMERVWSRFLELLQQAEDAVCRGLPVHAHTLNLVFSFCYSDLARMVSRLSDGVFLEPTQDPAEICSTLKVLWRHVQMRRGRLEQLTAKCDLLQAETPKDLSLLILEIQQAEARKQVWETLAACAEWREVCSTVLFSEMDVVQTQRVLEEQSGAVQYAHHELPLADSVLQRAVNELQQQRHQLEVLSTLKNSHLKYKHWKAVLRAVDLSHVPVADVMVGQLLSQSLEQKQCILEKIVWDAKAERQMECDFLKLQKQWSEKLVTLQRFPISTEEPWIESIEQRTWTVTDVDVHLSQIHLDVTMLSYMLTSPYSEDFRPELDHWLHLMNDLENTLHIFKRFQQMWIFLTKVLSSWSVSRCVDVKTLFKPADAEFRQVMDNISRDSHALIFLEHFHSFTSGLSAMDAITTQTREIFDFIQSQCSRLSGSGKTSCYSILAQALNFLATQSEKRNKAFVRPVVLFPNSMSHKELLGYDCDHKGWQDGALSTFLRNCGDVKGVENWLVLDGEEPSSRAEEPSWMDIAGALFHSPGPFMCLASGMPIIPPQEHLRVILEVTDLSAASPGALTACNLINFTGCDLWRAVWKSAMGSVLQKYQSKALEDLWETLAEELFPATLQSLDQNCASPANYSESASSQRPPIGLQEIMSFFRIFSALVEHFEVCLNIHNAQDKGDGTESRGVSQYQSDTTGAGLRDDATKMTLAQSCFLMAYVWGFGGHLHPSAWPRFQCIARKVLSNSRYKIQVPEGESLFEYFATSDRRVCLQTAALTSPKYGIYTHLMSIMLEAKRPVLLVGEPASGKTTVCQGLLGYKSPCVRLCGSAVMGPLDLLCVFRNTSRASQLLLFVDDLHATSPGFTDTSPALEVLRQSMSTGGVTVFADSSLRSLTTGTVSYMCTSSTPSPLSPRLTRLFSIFTLPVLTPDLIFSLHAHDLKLWTQTLLPNTTEMARSFVSATHSLYLALQEKYAHAVDGCGFSIYDIAYIPYKLDVLTETLRSSLQKHSYPDHEAGFLRAYMLHRQRARQLAHIFRVLLIPGAHAVLLASHAGTGRRSTVRCAMQLTGADLLEVHLGNEEELSMVLKEASNRCRVKGARVVLLVHADVSAAIREHLLLVMAGHTGRGLHTQEEIEKHVVTVTSNHLSQRYHRDQWMLDRLLSQSHKNIHIVMLMPHSSPEVSAEVSPELCTQWTVIDESVFSAFSLG